ncbi:MAG: hypothetical protein KJ914_11240 [Gammaproteobacteria bacterium]|nr:hypothetical protein [Gammaproteobacteria bacterium]MBU2004689.1 hypothetical protein [Gammaproteobacteria bacterium]
MLEALAENRDLQPNIEEADKMLTQVDVTRFASYQWGMRAGLTKGLEQGLERGIERGIQQGLERGIERGMKQGIERGMTQGVKIGKMEGKVEGRTEGEREKSRAIACNLLSLGVLAEADIAKVTGLTLEELQQIKNEH